MSTDNKDRDFAPINIDGNDRISSPQRRASSQVITKSNNGLVILLALLSILATAASVYLYVELEKSNQVISQNNKRLQSLEDRLSATGEELDLSAEALQVRISDIDALAKQNFSEIDKLWGSAWRRNQSEIKQLKESVENVSSNTNRFINQAKTDIENAASARQQLIGRIDSLNSKLNAQANEILAAKVEQEALSESGKANSNEMRDLNEKILLLERRNTNLVQQLNDLKALVDELINKSV